MEHGIPENGVKERTKKWPGEHHRTNVEKPK
jgi:hypothetical protein